MSDESHNGLEAETPRGNLAGLSRYWRFDLVSGFLVFLIALPLCLGIALACGYPPIAGIFTAVIGGVLTTFISNSELTIKGPAAGLIVIAIGCVNDFGGNGALDGVFSAADMHAYQLALGVGVAAAVLQIAFGLVRGGILGEFFPTSAVHGMLAAIGVIIIAKQLPVTLGVSPKGEPLELLASIPDKIAHMNPVIGLIGIASMVIMFGWPLVRHPILRRIPAAMLVLVVAIPLGLAFDLDTEHSYTFNGNQYTVGPNYLVSVPNNLFSAVTMPDFSGLKEPSAWKWVAMFAIIGTLESLLSAKAIDMLDPWRRQTDLDRDNTAVGVGNLVSAWVGGLPMISEIVRSKANIDNGARTRFSDLFHGIFLLLFVAMVPGLIHMIPLAALGAMLVYTGYRLASPREFIHVYKVGVEQLIVFIITIVAVLATDLLDGIAIGIAAKIVIHLINGASLRSFVKPRISVGDSEDGRVTIRVHGSAVFTSWISLKKKIEKSEAREVVVDLSETRLVDHTVMEKLHDLKRELQHRQMQLVIAGLDQHRPLSKHPHAARKKVAMGAA